MRKNNSLSQELYDSIKHKIINFEMLPGQIIVLSTMADEVGISRTPIREALIALCGDGLVTRYNGGKFKVSEISKQRIFEVYSVRQMIETHALSLITSIKKEDIINLQSFNDNMVKCLEKKDYDGFYNSDSNFHSYIVSMSNNSLLINMHYQLFDELQRIRRITLGEEFERSINQHQKIIELLEKNKIMEAKERLYSHLMISEEDFDVWKKSNKLVSFLVK